MNNFGEFNSIVDFVVLGAGLGAGGYIGLKVLTGSVPGIPGMVGPAAAGAVLGAMLYIFRTGVS